MKRINFERVGIAELEAIAKQLSEALSVGDIIVLEGDLGAGKTQFVKFCMKHLGIEQNVTSPSYTIANFYDFKDNYVIHADLYRLNSAEEFVDLELADHLENSITFIEWGTKCVDYLEDHLLISINTLLDNDNYRSLSITPVGDAWANKNVAFS